MKYLKEGLINPEAEYLSIKEIGKLFSPPISHVSLWKWQKQGKLRFTPYLFGNKKFYKKSEVLQVIEQQKINQ
ncbi:hypothetical protein [Flavivirga eckloniae]|uniref:Helix-turn-helix domain-containing protein n=1 Tax=Flavivirga eckloniae TaxID=1803846 RepID=A0A2K9PVX1_9FLAO|nr:hypothetical protein [Flavivirga eckloniae]AUP81221.1 hypothetical protein C1H87_21890 [Flavivirga eckloniae]